MEKNADLKTVKGLGRRYAWGALIQTEVEQQKLFEVCDVEDKELPCGCYDG